MNLSDGLFPPSLYWLAHLLALAALGWALWHAPWWRLKSNENRGILFAACVFLLLIWNLNAGIRPGLNYHLLGATLFTLMFGPHIALIAMGAVLLGITLSGGGGWWSLSLNFLLMVWLPVAFSAASLRLAVRWLPHNFFVYVIVNGYFTGGLAMGLSLGAAMLLLGTLGPYSFEQLSYSYLPYTFFLAFAEGFMSGMLSAGMALFRPEWLSSFDDRRYLNGK